MESGEADETGRIVCVRPILESCSHPIVTGDETYTAETPKDNRSRLLTEKTNNRRGEVLIGRKGASEGEGCERDLTLQTDLLDRTRTDQ